MRATKSMTEPRGAEADQSDRSYKDDLRRLWGDAVADWEGGYIKFPIIMIRYMKLAGMKAEEILQTITINSHRYPGGAEDPNPSAERIAYLMGEDPSTSSRRAGRLHESGMLPMIRGKQGRGHSNRYQMRPLLHRLAAVAEEDRKNADVERKAARVAELRSDFDALMHERQEMAAKPNRTKADLEKELDVVDRLAALRAQIKFTEASGG